MTDVSLKRWIEHSAKTGDLGSGFTAMLHEIDKEKSAEHEFREKTDYTSEFSIHAKHYQLPEECTVTRYERIDRREWRFELTFKIGTQPYAYIRAVDMYLTRNRDEFDKLIPRMFQEWAIYIRRQLDNAAQPIPATDTAREETE